MSSADLLAALEKNIDTLLADNMALKDKIAVLEDANERQRQEMIRTHAELAELQTEYKRLRAAHALLADSPEREQVKRQLTQMIHLVDKAIENLKAVES